MKIAAIDITRHRIPLDPPVPVSWDSRPRESFTINLIRVRTDQGLEGVAAGDSFAEHADLFLGRDPRDIERHHAVLDNLLPLRALVAAGPRALGPVRQDRGRAGVSPAGPITACGPMPRRRSGATRPRAARPREGSSPRLQAIKLRFSTDDWRRDSRAPPPCATPSAPAST